MSIIEMLEKMKPDSEQPFKEVPEEPLYARPKNGETNAQIDAEVTAALERAFPHFPRLDRCF